MGGANTHSIPTVPQEECQMKQRGMTKDWALMPEGVQSKFHCDRENEKKHELGDLL